MMEQNGVGRSSATEILRRLLDERGVEYDLTDRLSNIPSYQSVTWWFNTADKAEFREYHDGSTQLIVLSSIVHATPEQAIAATLGPLTERAAKDTEKDSEWCGACRAEEADTWECVRDDLGGYGKRVTIHVMECSACGQTFEHVNGDYEYCPRCGRKRGDVEE